MWAEFTLQEYFGDIVSLVPGHYHKASCNLFAGGGSCLQLVKNATFLKVSEQSVPLCSLTWQS